MNTAQPVSENTVTALLRHVNRGDRDAFEALVPVVYAQLRRLAHRALRRERRGHTLNTTALAHEAYAKLAGLTRLQWRDRAHFFSVAAGAMRRILVDYALSRKAQKRDGGRQRVPLDGLSLDALPVDGLPLVSDDRLAEVLHVDAALERLASIDPRSVRIVECRAFLGMTIDETAQALDLSATSVKRHWTLARAWLARELNQPGGRVE